MHYSNLCRICSSYNDSQRNQIRWLEIITPTIIKLECMIRFWSNEVNKVRSFPVCVDIEIPADWNWFDLSVDCRFVINTSWLNERLERNFQTKQWMWLFVLKSKQVFIMYQEEFWGKGCSMKYPTIHIVTIRSVCLNNSWYGIVYWDPSAEFIGDPQDGNLFFFFV